LKKTRARRDGAAKRGDGKGKQRREIERDGEERGTRNRSTVGRRLIEHIRRKKQAGAKDTGVGKKLETRTRSKSEEGKTRSTCKLEHENIEDGA